MDLLEYKKKVRNVNAPRKVKISNSYGNNEAYVDYEKKFRNNSPLTSKQFRSLINNVNKEIGQELITLGKITFPIDLGTVTIQSKERKPKVINGKVYYNAPVDWDKTLELWASDPESRVLRKLVKMPPGRTYLMKYQNKFRRFKNKNYIRFVPTRALKIQLKDRIKSNLPISSVEHK